MISLIMEGFHLFLNLMQEEACHSVYSLGSDLIQQNDLEILTHRVCINSSVFAAVPSSPLLTLRPALLLMDVCLQSCVLSAFNTRTY